MNKLLLAIDGGGSKTHAIITSIDGNMIEESIVKEGSNPWKSGGFKKAAEAIVHCLNKLHRLNDIKAAAVGISGCHGDTTFSDQFHDIIAKHLPEHTKIAVGGDLITSFRASSPSPHGQLAVAGSGSAIALFYPDDSHYVYDAVSYGGRDLGAAIIASVERGEQLSEVSVWLQEILKEDPVSLTNLGDVYHQKQIFGVAKALSELPSDSLILESVKPLILHCAWRWAYKLWGSSQKYRTRAKLAPDAPIATVLSGGLWQLDILRQETENLLAQSDTPNTLIFEPQKTALQGAVQIARELLM